MIEVEWLKEEFEGIELNDKRLNRRLIETGSQLSRYPSAPINQACEDWASTKGAYRLFNNKKVTREKILVPHQEKTVKRMEGEQVVLAIQDTSFLNYTSHEKKETGPIGSTALAGYVMHQTLATNGDGLSLGILTHEIWAREKEPEKLTDWEKVNRPIEEKESYKWLTAFHKCHELQPKGCTMVTICDREADIYELFVAAQKVLDEAEADDGKHYLLVRATQNRSLDDDMELDKLHSQLKAQPEAGRLAVSVPARNKEPTRTAIVTVRYTSVTFKPPYRSKKASPQALPPVTLTAISVIEENPPPHIPALNWFLLTNYPIYAFDDVLTCIRWYRCRWHIEVYFKVFKSGCRIEMCRLETQARLFPYLALMSIIAWRLYWLTHINRHHPDAPCTLILAEHEWQTLYVTIHRTSQLPDQPPSVYDAVRWIAQLGGFLARKSDGEPGVTTIWRGWLRLQDKAEIWLFLNPKTCG